MYSFDDVLLFFFYGSITLQYVGLVECKNGDYNERCNYLVCQNPQLLHSRNAAARLVTGIGLRDRVTPTLPQLHWLPVQYRITFKLCLLMHKIHTKRAPSYVTDEVTATADLQSRAGLHSPVPANIRLQGHVSKSAREAFPMQDLLHGIVSHITFEKSRTPRDSKYDLKLFCFKGRSSTFKLFRFRFTATFIFSLVC